MSRKRAPQAPRPSEEQINEVLANYDLECKRRTCSRLTAGEKQLARVERSANRYVESARIRMEARQRKVSPEVMRISLKEYYDMHTTPAAAERGRHMPPLAIASMPDVGV